MKKSVILNIARTELKLIFTTPVAWIMLMVFTVLCGLFFADVFGMYAQAQEGGSHLSFITNGIFSDDNNGILSTVQFYVFLFIPLVSMGMISRDLSTGSIKLLYSSPVTDTQIVMGKYVAMLGYGLTMLGVVILYALFCAVAIVNFDAPLVYTGILGLFLLISVYSAIGVFMSSLTSYQVVAALATFALLGVLSMINEVGQNQIWLRDITWWLSISGRCETFIAGLICSEDLAYFITLTALFLVLAIWRISNKRRSRTARVRFFGYAAAIAVTVIVSLVSSRPQLMWFFDVTATKSNTISVPSQKIMEELDGKVTMTTYVNILDENSFYLGLPSRFNTDKEYFKQFVRFKPDIKVKYEYFWADAGNKSVRRRFPNLTDEERAQVLSDVYELNYKMFQNPEEIAAKVDLSEEGYGLVRELKREDGTKTFLRIFDDSKRMPEEKEIAAAFKRLVDGPVPVGFLTGHDERSISRQGDRDYYIFAAQKGQRHSLVNNGFDAEEISLADGARIPDHIQILVIADPRIEFTENEIAEIQRYIESGRNMIIAADPGSQKGANQIASLVGGRFIQGRLVVDPSDERQDLVLARVTANAVKKFPSWEGLGSNGNHVTMPGTVQVAASHDKGFSPLTIFASSDKSWNEIQTEDFTNTTAEFDSKTERRGAKSIAIQMTREFGERTQKILLLGDSDCFSNGELMRQRYGVMSANFPFAYQAFKWLCDDKYPIDTPRAHSRDNSLRIGFKAVPFVKWGFLGLLPMLMLLSSILIIIRRKSR